ncbi:MAG: hypothetical protein Q7T33_10960 [Dehalococcoidia bacterium]|nr:hypothetical protein [Dehalococcoidia bacterium]
MRAVLALLLVTALGIGVGQAAGLSLSDAVFQTGSDSLVCDEDGVHLSYVTAGVNATGAKITGIDPACDGLAFTFNLFKTEAPTTTITGFPVHAPSQSISFAAVPISQVEGTNIFFFGSD